MVASYVACPAFLLLPFSIYIHVTFVAELLKVTSYPCVYSSHIFRLPDCSESGTVWSSCDPGLPGPSQGWAGCWEDQTKACQCLTIMYQLASFPDSAVARPPHNWVRRILGTRLIVLQYFIILDSREGRDFCLLQCHLVLEEKQFIYRPTLSNPWESIVYWPCPPPPSLCI